MNIENVVAIVFSFTAFMVWTITRTYIRRVELTRGQQSRVDVAIETRLANIERAVDAIAVEMERVSEGQRYTTRLLAERAASPASLGAPPRVDTPH